MVEQLIFDQLPLASQVSGNGEQRLYGRKELGAILYHAGEAFIDQTIQYFIDFLSRYAGPGRQFQRLKLWVP